MKKLKRKRRNIRKSYPDAPWLSGIGQNFDQWMFSTWCSGRSAVKILHDYWGLTWIHRTLWCCVRLSGVQKMTGNSRVEVVVLRPETWPNKALQNNKPIKMKYFFWAPTTPYSLLKSGCDTVSQQWHYRNVNQGFCMIECHDCHAILESIPFAKQNLSPTETININRHPWATSNEQLPTQGDKARQKAGVRLPPIEWRFHLENLHDTFEIHFLSLFSFLCVLSYPYLFFGSFCFFLRFFTIFTLHFSLHRKFPSLCDGVKE